MKRRTLPNLALVLACLGMLATARAANLTWNVAGNGAWDTVTANWTPGPTTFADGGVDSVTFNNIAGGTITIAAGMTPSATTVSATTGTYTFTGGPIDGTGALNKSGGGTLVLQSANSYSGGTVINGGITDVYNAGALGSGTISFNDGQLNFRNSNMTVTNPIVAGVGTAGEADRIVVYTGELTLAGGITIPAGAELQLGMSSSNLIFLRAPTTGDGRLRNMRCGLGIDNVNEVPNGNFYVGHVGGQVILEGVSWSALMATRTNGYGTGIGQWQLGGPGGFGARVTPLVISAAPGLDAGGTNTNTYFNRSFTLGSPFTSGGVLYANQPVTLDIDTRFTAAIDISISSAGPGLTGAHGSGFVHTITADLTDGGPALRGGVRITAFASPASLPTGNAGNTAYLSAFNRNGAMSGYLVTAAPGGATYDTGTNLNWAFGSNIVAVLGSTGNVGDSAALAGSSVLIHSDLATGSQSLNLLVRGGSLQLGTAANPLLFQPVTGNDYTAVSPNLPATVYTDATGARTLVKRGTGTLVLENIAYTLVNGTGNTAGQFTWQLGTGTNTVFDGAVRVAPIGTGTNANSLENFNVQLIGGVLESSGTFSRTLGTGASQVQWPNNTAGDGRFGGQPQQRAAGRQQHAADRDQPARPERQARRVRHTRPGQQLEPPAAQRRRPRRRRVVHHRQLHHAGRQRLRGDPLERRHVLPPDRLRLRRQQHRRVHHPRTGVAGVVRSGPASANNEELRQTP